MFSVQWFLEQLQLRLQCKMCENTDSVEEVYRQIVSGPNIHYLPNDLLATVLSFLEKKSIFVMMQVCKQWFFVINTEKRFWKRYIENALKNGFSRHNLSANQIEALKTFDPFLSCVDESLRSKVEWMFKPGYLRVGTFKDGTIFTIYRITFNKTAFVYTFSVTSKPTLLHISHFEVDETRQVLKNGFMFVKRMADIKASTKCTLLLKVPNGSAVYKKSFGQLYIPEYGLYEGDVIFNTENKVCLAHGNGRWVFHDGSVLEGKGIAYEDEPRFIQAKFPALKKQKN
ncbi:MAG: F-box protein [Nitrosomonas sp.]|nr:F-box protein [Nitrosomonas sp.]